MCMPGVWGVTCAICLEEFAAGNEAREMPCQHRFHLGCIKKWLSVHGTCLVCRFAMLPEEDATKVLGEGGKDQAWGQRPIVVMLVINGRGVSIPSSSHRSMGLERSLGSGSEDNGGSADSSPAQDTASGW
ncbi:E3 ubiquitin-protein ligase RING1-like [Eucalyptus grandis]|uniref:E3 ubiquitin-protein ligase RING1-like n=1 Tax=Eucalyptus grandis TaxID=71139 RepID=UPI0005249C21|nr:E3 ubiquitin-protein ligase RING1-like [Eucalyptus grandis]